MSGIGVHVARMRLTKRMVEGLQKQDADYIVFDTDLPGFGVRVMPSGKRFFLVQYRRYGRTRRVMIGQFGPVTAEVARREATVMLGNVRGADGDPAATRDAQRQSATMVDLGQRFLDEHVKVRCKPTTQGEYRRSVELVLSPFFGKQRVRSVTTADVADLHGSMARIPYQANRTLGILSKMLNLAEIWGIRDKHTNPCEDIQRYREYKRERFLSSAELQRLGQALATAEASESETASAVAAYRLLTLTGCRLSEIQKLKWDYVDFERGELRLPDSKTGAKTVHLGNAVIEVLKNIPRVPANPYVIAGKKEAAYLTDLQHPWERIRKAAGLEGARIHDLRHTFASGGLLVGEGLPVIGKLLGHTQVQTTARYAHLASDPVKHAANKIAERLASSLFAKVQAAANDAQESTSPVVEGESAADTRRTFDKKRVA